MRELNALRGVEYPDDPVLAARVASYELAFRMQQSVPEVMDFTKESDRTKALYGLDLPHCREFGSQLLAARRLVERGVRFIQIQHGGGGAGAWDAHSGLKDNHSKLALAVDQPISGCSRISTSADCSMKRWSCSPRSSAEPQAHKVPMAATITSSDSRSGWPAAG